MNAPASPFDAVPVSADAWFIALDHREIASEGRIWLTEVSGVHTDGHDWWIQLAAANDVEHGLVLHLSGPATVVHALDALRAHSRREAAMPEVVHVTRAA
jgi:hypothetical protein